MNFNEIEADKLGNIGEIELPTRPLVSRSQFAMDRLRTRIQPLDLPEDANEGKFIATDPTKQGVVDKLTNAIKKLTS